MMDLREILAPISPEQFFADLAAQRFRHIPGDPRRFDGLLPWSAVDRCLEEQRLAPPRARLAFGGSVLPPERYYKLAAPGAAVGELQARDVQAELRAGATLVLDGADEVFAPLTRFARSLERALGVRVQGNAYASFGVTHGFPTHWDDHHVLVIQLEGRKHWSIFGVTRDFPLERDVAQPPEPKTPVWEGVLQKGDVLYVPRGVWHRAAPVNEPSLHITFGMPLRTGVDLLGWVVDELRADETVRRDLPRYGAPAERKARADELRAAVLEKLNDGLLDAYFDSFDAAAKPRRRFSLRWVTAHLPPEDDARVELTAPRRLRLREREAGVLTVDAIGQRFRFSSASRPLLEALDDGEPHTITSLVAAAPKLARAQVRAFLSELLVTGLLVIVEP